MVPTYNFASFQNKTCIKKIFSPCGVWRGYGGAGGGGVLRTFTPPRSKFFHFYAVNRLAHPCLCDCRPLREMLDPQLAYLCSASLFLSLRLLARSLSSSAARCRSNSIRLDGSISSYRFLSLAFFFDGRPR